MLHPLHYRRIASTLLAIVGGWVCVGCSPAGDAAVPHDAALLAGGDATSTEALPVAVAEAVGGLSIEVASLYAETEREGAVTVGHPLQVTVGLSATARAEEAPVLVALVDEEGVGRCYLGILSVELTGEPGAIHSASSRLLVPAACLAGPDGPVAERLLRLAVSIDPYEELPLVAPAGAPVVSEETVRVLASAGLDLTVEAFTLASSVLALEDCPGPGCSRPTVHGADGREVQVDSDLDAAVRVVARGVDALLPGGGWNEVLGGHPLWVSYSIRPAGSDDEWAALTLHDVAIGAAPASRSAAVLPQLAAQTERHLDHPLYIEDACSPDPAASCDPASAARHRMLRGDWRYDDGFEVRVCVSSEAEPPEHSHDNCRTRTVIVLRPSKVEAPDAISDWCNDQGWCTWAGSDPAEAGENSSLSTDLELWMDNSADLCHLEVNDGIRFVTRSDFMDFEVTWFEAYVDVYFNWVLQNGNGWDFGYDILDVTLSAPFDLGWPDIDFDLPVQCYDQDNPEACGELMRCKNNKCVACKTQLACGGVAFTDKFAQALHLAERLAAKKQDPYGESGLAEGLPVGLLVSGGVTLQEDTTRIAKTYKRTFKPAPPYVASVTLEISGEVGYSVKSGVGAVQGSIPSIYSCVGEEYITGVDEDGEHTTAPSGLPPAELPKHPIFADLYANHCQVGPDGPVDGPGAPTIGGCYCDASCKAYGDCCGDFERVCLQGKPSLLVVPGEEACFSGRCIEGIDMSIAAARVEAAFVPSAYLGLNINASFDAVVVKFGVEVDMDVLLTELTLAAGLVAGVRAADPNEDLVFAQETCWGEPYNVELNVVAEIAADRNVKMLDGVFKLVAEHINIKWCKAWVVSVPCGVTYDEFWSMALASWTALSKVGRVFEWTVGPLTLLKVD